MLILILGLVLFMLPHLLRELGLRDRLKSRLPAGAYMGLYSLCAFAGLGLIIWGKSMAPFTMVFEPRFDLRYISSILMIPAFILVVAGNMSMSHIRWRLKNPMLLGVFIWSVAHLWSNGDLASLVLFGGFCLWSGLKFITLRNTVPAAEPEPAWLRRDLIAVILGAVLYYVVYVYHGLLFGVGLAPG